MPSRFRYSPSLRVLFSVPAFLILTFTPIFSLPSHAAGVPKPGDLSGDGSVDVRDAVLLLQSVAGMANLSPEAASVADVNADGSLDVIDSVLILRASETGSVPPSAALSASARFHVDLSTEQVEVLPLPSDSSAASKSAKGGFGVKAVFAGTKVVFHSSTVLDQPGDAGRKVLSVSLTNTSGEPMGVTPDGAVTGIRLLFSDFTNLSAYPDLRPKVTVSTLAGSATASCADGPLASATFGGPTGAAVDGDGTLYVADYGCNEVRKISHGLVSTLAGSGTAASIDGAGTAAAFNHPYGIAIDPADDSLIVSDYSGNRLRRVTKEGSVTLLAGSGVAGGADGAGNAATFSGPVGVAVGPAGELYVAEYGGHRVRKVTRTGADPRQASSWTVSTLAGSAAGAAGFADGVGSAARFNLPRGVAADASGAVYVADSGNRRVRRVSATGEVVTIAGTGVASSVDGSGDAATLNSPSGIALVNGAVAVSEISGQRVRQLTLKPGGSPGQAKSWAVQTLAGSGAAGSGDGPGSGATFNVPYGLASDGGGGLYVADYSSHRLRKVTPSNGYFPVGTTNGSAPAEKVQLSNPDGAVPTSDVDPATSGFISRPFLLYPQKFDSGETSAAREWAFSVPQGVSAFDFTVTTEADTHTLVQLPAVSNPGPSGSGSPDVIVRTYAGKNRGYFDGPASLARFTLPDGVATDAAGVLYVTEESNDTVRRVDRDGRVSTVVGSVGSSNPGPVDGPGHLVRLDTPLGVAAAPDGKTLYIAEVSGDRIRRVSLTGTDPTDASHWTVATIAGTGTDGYAEGRGNVAQFSGPAGLALDPTGTVLFVTEYGGQRVRRVQFKGGDPNNAANWLVGLVAGSTTGNTGSADGQGSAATFNTPLHLALDRSGNLYVAEWGNNLIRKIVNPTDNGGGTVSTFAGSTTGYADGTGAAAKFNQPFGITIDGANYLYVTDLTNQRVRRVSPSGVVTTVAGTGAAGSLNGPGSVATFNNPTGIGIDASGNLYVGERGGNDDDIRLIQRVLK